MHIALLGSSAPQSRTRGRCWPRARRSARASPWTTPSTRTHRTCLLTRDRLKRAVPLCVAAASALCRRALRPRRGERRRSRGPPLHHSTRGGEPLPPGGVSLHAQAPPSDALPSKVESNACSAACPPSAARRATGSPADVACVQVSGVISAVPQRCQGKWTRGWGSWQWMNVGALSSVTVGRKRRIARGLPRPPQLQAGAADLRHEYAEVRGGMRSRAVCSEHRVSTRATNTAEWRGMRRNMAEAACPLER